MRALPNLKVFSPADCLETIKVMEYAASTDEPMYIRLSGGLNCPIVYRADYEFEPGKMVCLSEKKGDIAVIATGLLVSEAVKAVKELEEKGVNCTLYNMHTIKPLDTDTLDEIFKTHKLVVTVEEHNVVGGMGSAVAEYKATKEVSPRQVFIGFNDSFLDAGSQRYVLEQAGLTHEKIAWRIEVEWENRA
jgi:transketolase